VKARSDYGEQIIDATRVAQKHGHDVRTKLALPTAAESATVDPDTLAVTVHSTTRTPLAITQGPEISKAP
jgi:hypothetical protein